MAMRIDTGVTALVVALLCMFKGAEGLATHKLAPRSAHSPPVGHTYAYMGKAHNASQVNCTALVNIYAVATGHNTNPEAFFDGYEDPYQTTGALSLQLELEDLQPEDVDFIMLGYSLTIYNRLYNYSDWSSNYALSALGDIDKSSPRGETIINVHPYVDDANANGLPPGFFNMDFFSDAPKTLHTNDTDILTKAFLPDRVLYNETECKVVSACQDDIGYLTLC